jgi:energy-converting hydrogenase A subunit R
MSRIQLNTDCEGPTCWNDNAFELSEAFFVKGDRFFKQLSNYDDFLHFKRSEYKFIPRDYATGDTLRLILPFLRAKGLTNKMMELFVKRVKTIDWMKGAREGYKYLKKNKSVTVFEISTSYAPFANAVADGIYVDRKRVYCTDIDLDAYFLSHKEKKKLNKFRDEIVAMPDIDADKIISSKESIDGKLAKALKRLRKIFWVEMRQMDCWGLIANTKVMNGVRKKEATVESLSRTKNKAKDLVYVGDSITDVEAFKYVRREGGLSISVNGNRHAINEAEIACIGKSSFDTALIVDRFSVGGKQAVTELIKNRQSTKYLKKTFPDIYEKIPKRGIILDYVTDENRERLIAQSEKMRLQLRKGAGVLS